MKSADLSKPDKKDAEHRAHEPVNGTQFPLSQKEELTSSDSVSFEIFYDGREVYGGY